MESKTLKRKTLKRKTLKHFISLMLVAVMMLTTMSVALVSVSAAETENVTYKLEIHTAGSEGYGAGIQIKVNGDNGSTAWHNLGEATSHKTGTVAFTDKNVGNMMSVTVKNTSANNNPWYFEYVVLTKENGGEKFTTTIYGGKWIVRSYCVSLTEQKFAYDYTFSVYENVYRLDIDTSNDLLSGTDANIFTYIYGENNKKVNLDDITRVHPKSDAFEKGDKMSIYVNVPSNFGKIKKIEFRVGGSGVTHIGADWKIDKITATKVSGENIGASYSKTVNGWAENGETKTVNFD